MLTDTFVWPTSSRRFLLVGAATSIAVFALLRLNWLETHALWPLTLAEGALALRLFGVPSMPIETTLACSGADAIALSLGAVLAYPVAWRRRLIGAAGAIALILVLNILRIGTLGRIADSRAWFNALHLYIWPAVITLAIAAYVLAWIRAADRAPRAMATETGARPHLSRRFLWLAAIFLTVFVAAAPLYLRNDVVLGAAGAIARVAAAILAVFGMHAFATANTLWTPHGGFVVTEECISTPLIPVYLAAVLAYATTWRWRTLGLVVAAPLFFALGVLRLLVVAVPDSVASQWLLIHAFYQLVSGGVLVMAAAFWRHRGWPAMAFGVAGIGAGIVIGAGLGPFWAQAAFRLAGPAAHDPQGAIALLPAFQLALYCGLWAAAFVKTDWKFPLAGLLVLAIAQMAGLFAINALDAHGVAVAIRDVRAWAVVGPALIFAAMVSLARPRR